MSKPKMSNNKNKPFRTKVEVLTQGLPRTIHIIFPVISLGIGMIGALAATTIWDITSNSQGLPVTSSSFRIVFSVLIGVTAGAFTIVYIAKWLYQQQTREKQLAIEKLKERKKAFFERRERFSSLVAKGEHRGKSN